MRRRSTCSDVRVLDLANGTDRSLLQANYVVEAPNWAPDGQSVFINSGGRMANLDLAGSKPSWITIDQVDNVNNDHLVSADGRVLYVSAGGAVYSVGSDGGLPTRLSPKSDDHRYYLHGISPDGRLLACTMIAADNEPSWSIQLLSATGCGEQTLLRDLVPLDGPEWSPDGKWLWFNGERGQEVPGHSRLFRMPAAGGEPQQMTNTSGVDWFPHPSPDGGSVAFLRYPAGTLGHPPDLPVSIMRMPAEGGDAEELVALFGGQGTINVNSWSPDSRYLAYVAYSV